MSENGQNALQQMEILNLGQLLNLVTNVTKIKIRELEKLHKSLITNAYGIIFNRTCINERLLPNFTNIYIYIYKYIYPNRSLHSELQVCQAVEAHPYEF